MSPCIHMYMYVSYCNKGLKSQGMMISTTPNFVGEEWGIRSPAELCFSLMNVSDNDDPHTLKITCHVLGGMYHVYPKYYLHRQAWQKHQLVAVYPE